MTAGERDVAALNTGPGLTRFRSLQFAAIGSYYNADDRGVGVLVDLDVTV